MEPPLPHPRMSSADQQSAKMGELEAASHHGLCETCRSEARMTAAQGARGGEAMSVPQETLAGVGC